MTNSIGAVCTRANKLPGFLFIFFFKCCVKAVGLCVYVCVCNCQNTNPDCSGRQRLQFNHISRGRPLSKLPLHVLVLGHSSMNSLKKKIFFTTLSDENCIHPLLLSPPPPWPSSVDFHVFPQIFRLKTASDSRASGQCCYEIRSALQWCARKDH